MTPTQAQQLPQASPETDRAKPARLAWDDPFLLDQMLTEEERMIRDTAPACCQDKLKPRALDGTHDVHALTLGRGITGMQAFQ